MRNLYVVRAYVLASSPAEAVRLAIRKSTPKEAWLHESSLEARAKALAEKLDKSAALGFGWRRPTKTNRKQ